MHSHGCLTPLLCPRQTPLNTASAILTENRDSLFLPVDIPGTKKQHFKLAYELGNFDSALENYNKWMKSLIEHDWPILFHPYLRDSRGNAVQTAGVEASVDGGAGVNGSRDGVKEEDGAVKAEEVKKALEKLEDVVMVDGNGEVGSPGKKRKREGGDQENGKRLHGPGETLSELSHDPPSLVTNGTVPVVNAPGHDPSMDEDIVIPKSLSEVVEVRTSTIPGAGRGLFAKRHIFPETILGFYFGVPMTEDDYDSTKDHVGMASHYSHRYRKTILDATDDQGQPFTETHPKLFCPFHFMNEHPERANMKFLDGYIVNQVICMTTKEIQAGEELFANYGKDVERHWEGGAGEVVENGGEV
ncbi:hypothetical protein HK097_007883 [Rhizophlyctis rosea]|uniref:SET domain-containing protein n=1 Tax=Rhizophlyctis rosea TaxID=64517 RepID=A0AAD5SK20_9FUNG|nr:hypothetical protein HK097_007883 [Rhizophlyctis rosea]